MNFPGRNASRSQSSDDSQSESPRNFGKLGQKAPERSTTTAVIIGVVIGMVIAYMVFPVEFTGAAPRHMSQAAIDLWVRMIAVGHSQDIRYDDANARDALQLIPDPQAVVTRLERDAGIPAGERDAISALKDIDGFDQLTGALAPVDPGLIGSGLQIIISLVAVAIAIPAVTVVWRTVAPASWSGPSTKRGDRIDSSGGASQAAQVPRTTPRAAPASRPAAGWPEEETERSGVVHPQFGVPVLHTVSTYVKGQNYDDSFAIELGPELGSQFLGECGISTATRIGNELQSVEFWGFDMASQDTQTKVFAAPAAVSDPALVAAVGNRLRNPSADIVAATLGAKLSVDASAIHIQAEIKSVVCNYGGGSPNSGIESLQIEIIAWQKQGQQSGTSAGTAPPGAEYAGVSATPPSQMPSPAPPPPAASGIDPSGSTSSQGKPPEDEEDDPFGGTGNFMPYS